jgi:AmmeMemoRadiSam system protein B
MASAPEIVRPPAVAGTFYPASPAALRDALTGYLDAIALALRTRCPKALVVPHAGYVYSAPIAASGYALLAPHGAGISRVVLLGPAHRAWVEGLAHPGATILRTPLGDARVDVEALASLPDVKADPAAHAREHSLEVQLPFLQTVAPRAAIVPLLVGRASPEHVGRVIDTLWGGAETVIVVSSDLTHYRPYDEGRAADRRTAERITALDSVALVGDEACGAAPINGLLWAARRRGLTATLLDLRSSGDTAGPRDEVVGYGSFAFQEPS